MIFTNNETFYPTPEYLLEKITMGIKWEKLNTVLEPSAGKGDIVEFIKNKVYSYTHLRKGPDVDCIELDPDLRCTLKGKDMRVVHDDFLTFHTFKKYDLIIMNPPFKDGAAHLLKALDMQKRGGAVLCILNAETIRNPYTNERKVLVERLNELGAEITYMKEVFSCAERSTYVEIAVIKVSIPEAIMESTIYEDLKQKSYADVQVEDVTDLALDDFVKATVAMYKLEVESGIKLIREYKAMIPHMAVSIEQKDSWQKTPILQLKIESTDATENKFVKCVRKKYWEALFSNRKIVGKMTSEMQEDYLARVEKLADYDFSIFNIKTLQEEMSQNLVKGIEDCIIKLFDELSHQYSWSDEFSKNVHYYNGWKTNKAWIINKKVILPYMDAFSSWSGKFDPTSYEIYDKLADIEKALNYLDGGLSYGANLYSALKEAENIGQTKNIRLKYFDITFYKKGTCHITFTNEELLKKLNIFGSQQKRWLPPSYGKKTYEEMDAEERVVVDEFEGKEAYRQTLENTAYFIYDPKTSLPALDTVA